MITAMRTTAMCRENFLVPYSESQGFKPVIDMSLITSRTEVQGRLTKG